MPTHTPLSRRAHQRLSFLLMALAIFALDQLIKAPIRSHWAIGQSQPLTPFLALTYLQNPGALFGILPNHTFALGIVSLLISVGIIVYVWRRPPQTGWLPYVALGILLGGALGNMSDRLVFGFVVDYLDLQWQGKNIWPVFNGADIAVDLGIGLLLLSAWLEPKPDETPPAESKLWLLKDTRSARKHGGQALLERQRVRLAEVVAYARSHSPYYAQLYQALPNRVDDPQQLPVTSKQALMPRFDDWITDRTLTLAQVEAFLAEPAQLGQPLAGNFVLTTSGTSGTPGVFLKDPREIAVTSALSARMLTDWLSPGELIRILLRGLRMAMIFAVDRPVATFTAATQLRQKINRWLPQGIGVFSVHDPLPKLVAGLNAFQPALISSYASTMSMLSQEQKTGRLKIHPLFITLTAEGLPEKEYERIAGVFQTKVRNSYAATECPFMSYSCSQGWLHVNTDWVIFEPVEANHQPTPKGQASHTVLISNLANRIQPILRYDLGDSVLERPDPCPCGNPLPAIRVQGRTGDLLTFPQEQSEPVALAPLAFSILLGHIQGVMRFQMVQTSPTALRLRLQLVAGQEPEPVWEDVMSQLRRLLDENGLAHVSLERAEELPEQAEGGKYREIIPFKSRAEK